jgi:hypothetical protein
VRGFGRLAQSAGLGDERMGPSARVMNSVDIYIYTHTIYLYCTWVQPSGSMHLAQPHMPPRLAGAPI